MPAALRCGDHRARALDIAGGEAGAVGRVDDARDMQHGVGARRPMSRGSRDRRAPRQSTPPRRARAADGESAREVRSRRRARHRYMTPTKPVPPVSADGHASTMWLRCTMRRAAHSRGSPLPRRCACPRSARHRLRHIRQPLATTRPGPAIATRSPRAKTALDPQRAGRQQALPCVSAATAPASTWIVPRTLSRPPSHALRADAVRSAAKNVPRRFRYSAPADG